jgi:hypothetical protein
LRVRSEEIAQVPSLAKEVGEFERSFIIQQTAKTNQLVTPNRSYLNEIFLTWLLTEI